MIDVTRISEMILLGAAYQPADADPFLLGGVFLVDGGLLLSPPFPEDASCLQMLTFDEFVDNGVSITFLKEDSIVGTIAPYTDYIEIDAFSDAASTVSLWAAYLDDEEAMQEFVELCTSDG